MVTDFTINLMMKWYMFTQLCIDPAPYVHATSDVIILSLFTSRHMLHYSGHDDFISPPLGLINLSYEEDDLESRVQCFSINVTSDSIIEEEENFTVHIDSTEIINSTNQADVFIIDTTGT